MTVDLEIERLREELATAEQQLGRHDPETAEFARALGRALQETRRYTEARELYERALAIVENERGPRHPDTAPLHRDLAELALAAGWFPAGERAAERALQARVTDGPDAAADRLVLAALLIAQGRHSEAEPVVQVALQTLGADSSDAALGEVQLAKVLGARGQVDEAATRYRRAVEIRRRVLGDNHPGVASALHDLGVLYSSDGRSAEAQDVWREASRILEGAS